MITIKNVLVATDFSPVSQTALVYGRALARTFDARLHVLHVVDDVSRFVYPDARALVSYADIESDIRRAAQGQLEACVGDDDRLELHAETVLRTGNHPAKEIADYADEARIDVIVIGATGRGAIDRLLTGSVADKVIRCARCPVLAVRRPEHEFVVPDALAVVTHAKA